MQQLGSLALIFLLAGIDRCAGEALQEWFERVGGDTLSRRRSSRERRFLLLPFPFIILLDDIGEHEPVPMTGHGADESGLAGFVTEHAPNGADGLAQRAVGDHDVAPDGVEDVAAMDGLVPPFDEENEQVEIARNERQLTAAAEQQAAPR